MGDRPDLDFGKPDFVDGKVTYDGEEPDFGKPDGAGGMREFIEKKIKECEQKCFSDAGPDASQSQDECMNTCMGEKPAGFPASLVDTARIKRGNLAHTFPGPGGGMREFMKKKMK